MQHNLTPEFVEALSQKAIEARKDLAISQALAKLNFINPEEARILAGDSIQHDNTTEEFFGTDSLGNRLSLNDYLRQFAKDKPYLLNHDAREEAIAQTSKTSLKTAKAKSEFINHYGYDAWERLPLK